MRCPCACEWRQVGNLWGAMGDAEGRSHFSMWTVVHSEVKRKRGGSLFCVRVRMCACVRVCVLLRVIYDNKGARRIGILQAQAERGLAVCSCAMARTHKRQAMNAMKAFIV